MPILTLPEGVPSLTVRAKALVFEDPTSRELLSRIEQVAPSDATILLNGETGTGKEIVARHIHQLSRRAGGPLVAVNCGAFSENLVESELFGHEKGAFTGAAQAKPGWFETARGGTLFLDEVGDLPLSLQVKLLRVLQEREVVRLGSRRATPIDVRLIAATNVELHEAMLAGRLREDLYYRLSVVSLTLLPLRERIGDIEPLAAYFIELYCSRLGLDDVALTPSALQRLLTHAWPGNIRELENTIHHALLICQNGRIEADDIRVTGPLVPGRSRSSPPAALGFPPPAPESTEPLTAARAVASLSSAFGALFELGMTNLHELVEETLLRSAYRHCEQNQVHTARLLGVSRNVVRARLIQFGELKAQPRKASERCELPSNPPSDVSSTAALTLKGSEGVAEPGASVLALRPARSVRGREVLRIGYQRFGQLLLVKALGELDRSLAERGVAVDWIEFPAGLELLDAMQADKLDLGVVGECAPVFAQARAAPIVYVAAEPAAPEAEAILVPRGSPLQSIAELRSMTVALSRGANVHYLLIRALEEVGVPYADVRIAFMAPERARRAFAAGEVDAWGIWDPILSCVRHTTGARVLRDGRGLTKNSAYYIARGKFLERAPELVNEVLIKCEEGARFARSHSSAAALLLGRDGEWDRSALEAWLRRLAGIVRLTPSELLDQQEIADRLYHLRLVPHAVRVADARSWPSIAV